MVYIRAIMEPEVVLTSVRVSPHVTPVRYGAGTKPTETEIEAQRASTSSLRAPHNKAIGACDPRHVASPLANRSFYS